MMEVQGKELQFKTEKNIGYFLKFELLSQQQEEMQSVMKQVKKTNNNFTLRKYFNMRFKINTQTFVGEVKEGMIATSMIGMMDVSAINDNQTEFQTAYMNET